MMNPHKVFFLLILLASSALRADVAQLDSLLGPAYPVLVDDRPTNYVAPSYPFTGTNIPPRVNPYQLGLPNADTGDYWSSSGQVAYYPDVPGPGLLASAHHAYYRGVVSIGPKLDVYRGVADPDPSTRVTSYITANGDSAPSGVVGQVRSTNTTGNDAFVVWQSGLITVASTQTGHGKIGMPHLKLPETKTPLDIAVSSNNELLLVAVHDTDAGRSQLAVIMVEAKGIPFHTFSQMGLPNQASVSEMKLLGYVDLPFTTRALRVSAANNGHWGGPSATNGQTLGQLNLTSQTVLTNLYTGAWAGTISTAGYAVVTARDENAAVVVDLTNIYQYIRHSWLSSLDSFNKTTAAEAAGTWPATFADKPELSPTIVATFNLPRPVSVLCGHTIDRWSPDRYKFHIGLEEGELVIFDASYIMARFSWHRKGPLAEMGRMQVGANPISLAFSRRNEGQGNPLFASAGHKGDGHNNVIWLASRRERKLQQILTVGGKGTVLREISDKRLQDPVNLCTAVRAYILLVCDFKGKQVIAFRIGNITDTRREPDVTYRPAQGLNWYEIGGILSIKGHPYIITDENVN